MMSLVEKKIESPLKKSPVTSDWSGTTVSVKASVTTKTKHNCKNNAVVHSDI